jgi:uncharacterized SAM-binding protein YcdF (DUF218 family)
MKAILLSLVMPPTGFITLIIIGLLLRGRWYRAGRRLTWAAAILLLLSSLSIVSDSALVALETDLPTTTPADHPPQAIVVLGAETARSTRNGTVAFRPGLLTLDRLRSAAALHRQTGLPILATGGVSTEQTEAVGLVMARSLRDDFQTPARWVEWKSRDTWENARYSAEILRAEGITSIYVVTSAWHMKRALVAFQGTGLTVTAAPTPPDDPDGPQLGDFMPHASNWQTGYYAMHEWIGLLYYRLR